MIFDNVHFGKEVTIDIDSYFYYFVRPPHQWPEDERQGITLKTVRSQLSQLLPKLGNERIFVYYRRSSNDHAHVKIILKSQMSVLDGFMIRAWMMDDQTRLSLDLARYLKTNSLHEMNRCFDEKATIESTNSSGPWIPITYDPEHYYLSKEISNDWSEYLPRWEQYKKDHPQIFGKPSEQTELL